VHSLLDLAKALVPAAHAAGDVTLKYFRTATAVNDKSDGSPVTLADQEAEDVIKAALHLLAPDIPVLGEEAVAAGRIPDISSGRFFCIDPLDGTREFIAGGVEYSVNIALLENFRPVMGLIYAPATGQLYYAADGKAFRQKAGGAVEPMRVRPAPAEGLTVLTSKRHGQNQKLDDFLSGYKVREILSSSSAIKVCTVAEGAADLDVRLGPTSEWDTAAGEAIVTAAGGRVTDLDGRLISYGKTSVKFLNTSFVALGV
jgi:3'(2'), 5'-bisphosphate nucleotidase